MNQNDKTKEATEKTEKTPATSELKSEELDNEQLERISGGDGIDVMIYK
jgi:hypothetical protein